jgi:hypothetical protein
VDRRSRRQAAHRGVSSVRGWTAGRCRITKRAARRRPPSRSSALLLTRRRSCR